MLFEYKAINKAGETYEGTAEAEDRYALARRLRQDGENLISVSEEGKSSGNLKAKFDKINSIVSSVKTRDKILFARNMSAMLGAGLAVSRALSVIERQTKNKKFKDILSKLNVSVREGKSLSAALAGYPKIFPKFFVSMVKAGEESGKLSDALLSISSQMERTQQLKKKIKGAMMYPSIVISAMVLVGIVMFIFVVPTLTSTFKELEIDLPASTRAIIFVSDFMSENVFVTIGIILAVVIGAVFTAKSPAGKKFLEKVFLKIPVINTLIKETNAARTARTLSSLLRSGVEVVSAIDITKDVVQNSQFKAVLEEAEGSIQKGTPISEVFVQHEDLYPILFGEMMSVGEEVGDMSKMLEEVATFYEEEVSQKTKDMSTIIEPILMILIGSVVGFFAVSMISPIYSISGGI